MGDYREIEFVVSVIGLKYNAMTDEQPNKIITLKQIKEIDDTLTLEQITNMVVEALQKIEDDN